MSLTQIDLRHLKSLVDLATYVASGANRQPLKYVIYNTPEYANKIFPYLAWAAYLDEWAGPEKGERP